VTPSPDAPLPAAEDFSGDSNHLFSAAFVLIAIILSTFAFWGISTVPFHPDESTYLFMSSDFETLFSNPLSLAWDTDVTTDSKDDSSLRAHYRLVDTPMTRDLLGLARWVSGFPPLPADWDWSKTWEQNQAAGAIPEEGLLRAGRVILTLFIPLNLWLIYRIGVRLHSHSTGLLAALLFGLNALVLLHNRRAMAEAALTFGVLIALWSFLEGSRRAWVVGLALAFAINTKQTAYALLPVGLLAVALPPFSLRGDPNSSKFQILIRVALNWAEVLLIILLVTLALNPFLWKQPVQAIQAAWAERQELMTRQVNEFNRLNPESSLNSPPRRTAALIANLYMTMPAFAEISNYAQETAAAEQQYLANPANHLLRGMLPGGILFALTLAGIGLAGLKLLTSLRAHHTLVSPILRRRQEAIFITLISTFTLGVGIYWLIPLPWQRYLMPLVPFVCLWIAYAITIIFEPFQASLQKAFQARRRIQP